MPQDLALKFAEPSFMRVIAGPGVRSAGPVASRWAWSWSVQLDQSSYDHGFIGHPGQHPAEVLNHKAEGDMSPKDLKANALPIHAPTRLLCLQHPSKVDHLCAWDEKIVWCITHIAGKRSK
jgi:hypothetical protein